MIAPKGSKIAVLFNLIILLLCLPACAPAQTASQAALPEPSVPPASVQDLRAILLDDDDQARLDAITKLQQDGSPQAVAILGEYFTVADRPGRVEAGVALLTINTEQAQGYIRAALSDQRLTARRQAAMESLEKYGDAASLFLQALLRDPNETIRLNTVQVVQFTSPVKARALLQIALSDPSPAVQQAAAEALRALGYVPTPSPQP